MALKDVEHRANIMACGNTGVGKSTILNGIIGDGIEASKHQLAVQVGESDLFRESPGLEHETKNVDVIKLEDTVNNVKVNVYDTPGFEDATGQFQQNLDAIKRETESSNIDLLLYCISIDNPRATLAKDKATLKKLKGTLKSDIWNHCIVVLTFANALVKRLEHQNLSRRALKSEYQRIIGEWKTKVQQLFKDAKIDIGPLRIIPAGRISKPSLLDDGKFWLSDLWNEAIEATTEEVGETLFLITSYRTVKPDCIRPDANIGVPIEKQWIVISSPKAKKYAEKIGAMVTAGGIAGTIGAAIGATIGAVGIGVLSFGPAAGTGLVLGAGVGFGIGVGIGAAATKIADTVKGRQAHKTLDSEVNIKMH